MSDPLESRAEISSDARRLLLTRGLRGFGDGLVSVLLAAYLTRLGLSATDVGVVVTSTLLGSAVLTLYVGLASARWPRRQVLLAAALLMALTGLGFAGSRAFAAILVVAAVGTLNPSAGDVSLFLPIEQAVLSETIRAPGLTRAFALYNVLGALGGALGALASGLPRLLSARFGWAPIELDRASFLLYAGLALIVGLVYLGLSPAIEGQRGPSARAPLARSRKIVIRLSTLFCLDAFGGGFVVQSILALWLFKRFALEPEVAGVFFFASGLLNGASQFASPYLVGRVGRINTMVMTHLLANAFLIIAGLMPSASLALLFLLFRAAFSQMDVPARQSFVMTVVPPEERAAASSVTNVPRSLAAAVAPVLAGLMLERSVFGWPLVVAGGLKVIYDLLMLASFGAREAALTVKATQEER